MYNVAVKYKCFDDKREQYIELLEKEGIVSAIRNEEGCISYEYYLSHNNKNVILLIEKWESKECQIRHLSLPHTKKMLSYKGDYVKSTDITEFNIL